MSEFRADRRILFLVNGLGMGNSTRCYSIIRQLNRRGFIIEVATSANGLLFFKDKPEVQKIHSMGAMYYGKGRDDKLDIFRTLVAVLFSLRTFVGNGLALLKIVRESDPAVIVYDSQYNLFPVFFSNARVVALNNADMVVDQFFKIKAKPASIFPQFFAIELMDFLFQRVFISRVLSPWVDTERHGQTSANLLRVPLIVREEITPSPSSPQTEIRRVVIMLSGSTFGLAVDPTKWDHPWNYDVIGRHGQDSDRVKFHGKIIDNIELLRNADILVINAGFSAVSEALVLAKPIVVIPIENHAEQFINAKIVERYGVGLIAGHDNVAQRIMNLAMNIGPFRQRIAETRFNGSGAEVFANCVDDLAREIQPSRSLKEFIFYCLAAVASLLADYAAFALLFSFLNIGLIPSQTVARVLGGGASFLINYHFNFASSAQKITLLSLRRFIMLYLVSFAVSIALITFCRNVLQLSPYASKIVSDSSCFLFNFAVMKYYVYTSKYSIRSMVFGIQNK